MEIFKEQMNMIKNFDYQFYDPNLFITDFDKPKNKKEILITIDDGFKSFYNEAWPYLKKTGYHSYFLFLQSQLKIGYMNWDEIKEIEKSDISLIGHHSHTHEYLIDMNEDEFINDIETVTKIFKGKLGYVQNIFISFLNTLYI